MSTKQPTPKEIYYATEVSTTKIFWAAFAGCFVAYIILFLLTFFLTSMWLI